MDSQAPAAPYPRKTSAFLPVVKNDNESPALPIMPFRHNEREEVIFQSSQPLQQDKNPQSQDHPSEDYYCMTCHQNFNIRISPCNHKKGRVTKYKCDYDDCKREFNIGSGLERHKLVHTGARPYECDFDQCDQKFNQKSNLNRHRRIHTQQKPFICQKCCKSFTTTTNLKQHVQVHLEDKERRKKYVCQIKGCNKEYLYMCNLKKHKQEHEDPLSECIGERKPDFPTFSLLIGNCSFKILYKRSKDHSELLITYREVENAQFYEITHFSKALESMNESQEKNQLGSCMEEIDTAMEKLFQNKGKNAVNVCFQMHPDLSPVANLVVKAAMGMTGTMGAKIFTVIMPSYAIFRDVIQNLLYDLQPE